MKRKLKANVKGWQLCGTLQYKVREVGEKIGKFYYYTHRPYFIIIIIVDTSSHSILPHFNHIYNKICGFNLSARNWHRTLCIDVSCFACGRMLLVFGIFHDMAILCIPQFHNCFCAVVICESMRALHTHTHMYVLCWDWCLVCSSRKCESKLYQYVRFCVVCTLEFNFQKKNRTVCCAAVCT